VRSKPLRTFLPPFALLLFFCALLLLTARTAGAGTGAADLTPTPSATPWVDPFSADLTVKPQQQAVLNGDELRVTVDLDVVEGCRYPVLELTLTQQGDEPAFIYIDPPAKIVGPPLSFPVTYRLRAVRPGEIVFRAQTYGERNCGDFWNWHYLDAFSDPVLVQDGRYNGWLPFISAQS
jgi:hypothetical protein